MDDVRVRLGALEARLARLEASLRESLEMPEPSGFVEDETRPAAVERPDVDLIRPAPPCPSGDPVAGPARASLKTEVRPAAPASRFLRGEALERFLGLSVLGRVGVAAVLLTAAYFAQLAYRATTPELKVLSIYLLAGAFVGAGFLLQRRVVRTYVALLWGGGASAAYLAGISARLRYEIVGPAEALMMLLLACALGQWLAYRLRHPRVASAVLASTAIAGAFAAPLLVGTGTDHRTLLLLYVLLLHGWAAHAAREWPWTRAVGLVGAAIVGLSWCVAHGGVDVSTFVHVNAYLLGLAAPELGSLARGRVLSPERRGLFLVLVALVHGALWYAAVLIPFMPPQLPGYGWVAGALCLAMGLGLLLGRKDGDRASGRGLLAVGAVFLALAPLHLHDLWNLTGVSATNSVVVAAGLVGLGLVALRRRFGAGELGACVAAGVAVVNVATEGTVPGSLWLLPVAMAVPALLFLESRRSVARAWGALLGGVALTLGLTTGEEIHPGWIAGGLAAGALWWTATLRLSRTRRDWIPTAVCAGALLLLAIAWAGLSFWGGLAVQGSPLWNPSTLSAVAIVALAGRGAREPDSDGRAFSLPLWIVSLGVGLLAGYREVDHAVGESLPSVQNFAYVAYLAVAALVVGGLGRRLGVRGIQATSQILAWGAVLKLMVDGVDRGFEDGGVLAFLAAAVAVLGVAKLLRRREHVYRTGAVAGVVGIGLAWGASVVLHPASPSAVDWGSVELGAGLIALGTGMVLRRSRPDLDGVHDHVLLGFGLGLGYLVGLHEVHVSASALGLDRAWPDVLVSVFTALYAAGALIFGFRGGDPRLRYAALFGFVAVAAKIGLHDLAAAELPLRILATGVLGVVLLVTAFSYARRERARQRVSPGTEAIGAS